MPFYLASQSPRRRELLQQIGVEFQLLQSEVDESRHNGEAAGDYVCRLAAAKARAGAALLNEPAGQFQVLGADTTVVVDGDIVGKPADDAEASSILERLSGRSHQVMSAVSLFDGERQGTRLAITEVVFKPLQPELIERYLATGESRDKAGAYGIQGYGALLVERITGSYSAVVGLPLETLAPLLDDFGVAYWQQAGAQR